MLEASVESMQTDPRDIHIDTISVAVNISCVDTIIVSNGELTIHGPLESAAFDLRDDRPANFNSARFADGTAKLR